MCPAMIGIIFYCANRAGGSDTQLVVVKETTEWTSNGSGCIVWCKKRTLRKGKVWQKKVHLANLFGRGRKAFGIWHGNKQMPNSVKSVSKSMWDRGATGESCPPDSIAPFPWRNPEDTTVTEILGIEGLPTQIGLVSVSIHFSLPIWRNSSKRLCNSTEWSRRERRDR